MASRTATERMLRILIVGCLAAILLISVIFAYTTPLFSDDYCNTATLCRLMTGVPYRDFAPWNTLLGHFVQLPVFLLNPDPVFGLYHIRLEMALLTTLFLGLGAWYFLRLFRPEAVLLGLLLIAGFDMYYMNSIPIRLDALSAWAAFAALLCALRERWAAAGLLTALSYLISQKGVYHFLSLNLGLGALLLLTPGMVAWVRNCARLRWSLPPALHKAFGTLLRYNLCACVPVLSYYLLLVFLWGFQPLVRQQEFKLSVMKELNRLHGLLELSLEIVFQRNYSFTLCALAGLACALWFLRHRRDTDPPLALSPARRPHLVLALYLAGLAACSAVHPHPYGYYWIIITPPLWYAATLFFDTAMRGVHRLNPEKQTALIASTGALLLLLGWLLIPRVYWTESFTFWMSLLIPVLMLVFCLPLYLLSRRFSRTRPAVLPPLFLGLVAACLLTASTIPSIAVRIKNPAAYNMDYFEAILEEPLQKLLAQQHSAPAQPKQPETK